MDPVQDNPQSQVNEGSADNTAGQSANPSSYLDIMSGAIGKTAETKTESVKPEKVEAEKSTKVDNAENPAWMAQLPGELLQNEQAVKQLVKFGKIGDLAKSYTELEAKLGRSVTLPGKDAQAEEVQAFYEKLGKPQSAEKYELPKDDMNFSEIAFKNNLTVDQAKAVYEAMNSYGQSVLNQQMQLQTQTAKATDEALRAQWGDKYQEKVSFMQKGLSNFGGKPLYDLLSSTGVIYSKEIADLFIQLGEISTESATTSRGVAGGKTSYKSTDEGGSFTFKGL